VLTGGTTGGVVVADVELAVTTNDAEIGPLTLPALSIA
jgi:hypothetical protein